MKKILQTIFITVSFVVFYAWIFHLIQKNGKKGKLVFLIVILGLIAVGIIRDIFF